MPQCKYITGAEQNVYLKVVKDRVKVEGLPRGLKYIYFGFKMKGEDQGVMIEWVTAGDVFMCSALPLGVPVINGSRFISESAMPPALLTLSVTQPDAWMCTRDRERSLS